MLSNYWVGRAGCNAFILLDLKSSIVILTLTRFRQILNRLAQRGPDGAFADDRSNHNIFFSNIYKVNGMSHPLASRTDHTPRGSLTECRCAWCSPITVLSPNRGSKKFPSN